MRNAGMWLNFAPAMAAIIIIGMVALRAGLRLLRANSNATAFELRFWSGGALDELQATVVAYPVHPMVAVFGAGMAEWQRAAGIDPARSVVNTRIAGLMALAVRRQVAALALGLPVIATIRFIAPLIGLASAAWTAALGGGLADALVPLATGTTVAIPAALAYEVISAGLTGFSARLDGFALEFAAILSRQGEGGTGGGGGKSSPSIFQT